MDERFFVTSELNSQITVLSKKGSVFIDASSYVSCHWTFATSLLSDRRSRRYVQEEQDGIGQYKNTGQSMDMFMKHSLFIEIL
jgi:hypothetical protein